MLDDADATSPREALFRADASPSLGAGHLVRCLAIAEELRDGGFDCFFLSPQSSAAYLAWVRDAGHAVLDGESSTTEGRAFSWAIVDDYSATEADLEAGRPSWMRSLVIDDLANRRLPADVLVNPNPWARADDYRDLVEPGTRVLVGTRFAPVRRAFKEHDVTRGGGPVRRVLVALGGGGSRGTMSIAVAGVRAALPLARIDVVRGPVEDVDLPDDDNVTVHGTVGAAELAGLMGAADIAVAAGGTGSWERCATGLPSIVIAIAENQVPVARSLASAGAAVDLGSAGSVGVDDVAAAVHSLAGDADRRSEMSRRSRELVDGLGARRVANLIDGVRVRPPQVADSATLFRWANDPVTRSNSLHRDPISRPEHEAWLARKLEDPATVLLIGENRSGPVGQVRFDLASSVEVSISVAPEHRGQLVGELLLEAGTAYLRASHGELPLVARVRTENEASRRMFERAGFRAEDTTLDVLVFERGAQAS